MSAVKSHASVAAKQFLKVIMEGGGFNGICRGMEVVEASDGRLVTQITIEQQHTNIFGTLHGGMSATLVDVVTSGALMTKENQQYPGVSVDMNVTYLRPGMLGQTILCDASVLKFGKKMAFTTCDIRLKDDNSLLVQGRHTKAFPQS